MNLADFMEYVNYGYHYKQLFALIPQLPEEDRRPAAKIANELAEQNKLLIPPLLEESLDIVIDERGQALLDLLKPIRWPGGSDIWQRKQIVTEARNKVYLVIPFLTPGEKALANDWLAKERHDGLWE